jgi:hypothetical protein
MVFGYMPSDDVTTTLWRFLAAGFVVITGTQCSASCRPLVRPQLK